MFYVCSIRFDNMKIGEERWKTKDEEEEFRWMATATCSERVLLFSSFDST